MKTVRTIRDLRTQIGVWRRAGQRVGLVPTMGALHEGHLALVRQSVAENDHTVVTLFVNPTQFGEGEDFESYPRDEDRDRDLVAEEGAELLFAPAAAEVYPPGHTTRVNVGPLGDILEGHYRPEFFTGVATIVSKLLLQALSDAAYFGEKDYQQLQVITKLVKDLDIPVTVRGVATVREADGLALSSRNMYLTDQERAQAPQLHTALQAIAVAARRGDAPDHVAKAQATMLVNGGFSKVDYLTLRDAETLEEQPAPDRPKRVLGAAWLGRARLIDNIPV